MTDGDALLKAIIAHPDEDVPRLLYADWLDETGQPERANLIRWMVNYPTWFADATCLRDSDTREPGYLAALEWFKDGSADEELSLLVGGGWATLEGYWVWHRGLLVAQDFHVCYARGFVSEVSCTAADWLAVGDAVRAAHPVTAVRLTTTPHIGNKLRTWRTEERFGDLINIATVVALVAGRETRVECFEGEDMTPYMLTARWPGVTFDLPAPAHATA